jgi:hypothetical protein
MKPKKRHCVLIACIFLGCHAKPTKEKTIVPTIYNNDEIGWQIEIPLGYQLRHNDNIKRSDEKGRDAIGQVYEGKINAKQLRHLVSFQKNQLNLMDSTIEPYRESYKGEYAASNKLTQKLIYDTYSKQKIKIDTSSAVETIGKHQFNAFYIKIYGPNGDGFMNQIMYSTLLKGYDFGVNITYNNDNDKELLLNVLKQSKFVD